MHHRHLLPNEIDLLLDEESGFGVQPLVEHVRGCASCRGRLDEAKVVVDSLAELPLLAPRMGLADRVMADVPVFVPWHVAARDSLSRWVPVTQGARVLAAALVAIVGSVLTGMTLWIATRGDMLALFAGLVGESARSTVSRGAGDLVVAMFGPQMIGAVQQVGTLGIALAGGGFLAASGATILGLKLIASSARARS